ncbi:MAG: glycosyl hydrolase [Cyanobacteria bacterium RYN_339]|nr:glycosyl hydrolase [Cyanobacteria bacterium RYN_339]
MHDHLLPPALVGNTRAIALIDPDGSVAWLALPLASDAPLFDRHAAAPGLAGAFTLAPLDATAHTRAYVGETAVLRTTWETASGSASVLDYLPLRPGPTGAGKVPHDRLVRVVEGIAGEITFEVRLAPLLDGPADVSFDPNGILFAGPTRTLILQTEQQVHPHGGEVAARFTLKAGEKRHFVLTLVADGDPDVPEMKSTEPLWDLDGTFDFWLGWARELPFQGVQRPAVLKLASAVRAALLPPEAYLGGLVPGPGREFALGAPVALASWGWTAPFEAVLAGGPRLAAGDAAVAASFFAWLAPAQRAGLIEANSLPAHWAPWAAIAERLATAPVGPAAGLRGAADLADDLLLEGDHPAWLAAAGPYEPPCVDDVAFDALAPAAAVGAIAAELEGGAYLQARRRMDRWLQAYDPLAPGHDWLASAHALALAARLYLAEPPTPGRVDMPGDLGT